jgi:hypothetical protein
MNTLWRFIGFVEWWGFFSNIQEVFNHYFF